MKSQIYDELREFLSMHCCVNFTLNDGPDGLVIQFLLERIQKLEERLGDLEESE